MRKQIGFQVLCIMVLMIAFTATSFSSEVIPSEVCSKLGISPNIVERFETVYTYTPTATDKERPADEYNRIMTKIDYAHLGDDVHLWRIDYAGLSSAYYNWNTAFYINADNNSDTGRAAAGGTEELITFICNGGSYRILRTHYTEDGTATVNFQPTPIFAMDGTTLYLRYDGVPKNEKGGKLIFAYRIITEGWIESQNKRGIISGTSWFPEVEVQRVDEKYYAEEVVYGMGALERTYGLDIIRKVQTDPDNHVIPALKFELQGFKLHDTSHETYSVQSSSGGKLTAKVDASGTFYPGFVIYDESGSQEYILSHNGTEIGRARGDENNNREWLIFSNEPIQVNRGDEIVLEAKGQSSDKVYSVILLQAKPPIINAEFNIENVKWFSDEDKIILSCTTTKTAEVNISVAPDIEVIRTTDMSVGHRFELNGLKPLNTYNLQIDAQDLKGVKTSKTIEIKVPAPLKTWNIQKREVPLIIDVPQDIKETKVPWPVTAGIPLPQGEVPNTERIEVLDKDGESVVAQFSPLTLWEDNSIKWLLVQFQIPDISQVGEYQLVYGSDVEPIQYNDMVIETSDKGITVVQGTYNLVVPNDGNMLAIVEGEQGYTLDGIVSIRGVKYCTKGERQVKVDEAGPIRTVLLVEGQLQDDFGNHAFDYEIRLYAYSGLPMIQVSTAIVNTNDSQFTVVDDWSIRLNSTSKIDKVQIGLGDKVAEADKAELTHIYYDQYKLTLNGETKVDKGIAQGWVNLNTEYDEIGVAVRYFPEKYPKQFATDGDNLLIGLAAPFEKEWYVDYGGEDEKYGLHFYLQEGGHKLRQGMSVYDELLLLFPSGGEAKLNTSDMAKAFQKPPIMRAQPEWYIDSQALRVYGGFATVDQQILPGYEELVDEKTAEYVRIRDTEKLYGSLNFGDWYGEREVNWGDNEYDIAFSMFTQYLRSGDPRAFYIGQEMAIHFMNIDICHYASAPVYTGAVYQHSIGHTGGYYDKSPFANGEGIVRPYPVHPGHWVLEGLTMQFYMTGDKRALSIMKMAADRWNREVLQGPYDWVTEVRKPGWFLINNIAVYEATRDPYYLNAAALGADRVLERQSADGAWPRLLRSNHCVCDLPCIGNTAFSIGTLIDGLHMYYTLTKSDEVKDSIISAARCLISKEHWDSKSGRFKYSSCKEMRYTGIGSSLEATIAYAAELTNDRELISASYKILKSMVDGGIRRDPRIFSKILSMTIRRFPTSLAALERCDDIENILVDIKKEEGKITKQHVILGTLLLGFVAAFALSTKK